METMAYIDELVEKGSPEKKTSKLSIKYTKPSFQVNSFHTKMDTTNLSFHVIKMNDSLFLWIGKFNEPLFTDLSIGIIDKLTEKPTSSKIVGSNMDSTSINLANRLSKKLNKPVFVSCNMNLDMFSLPFIEKCVSDELKQRAHVF